MDGKIFPSLPGRIGPRFTPRTWLALAGVVLLGVHGWWWAASVRENRLVKGHRTWVPAYHFLGVDFLANYLAGRHWWGGGNPYTEGFGDPLNRPYIYPKPMLWFFPWCGWVSPRTGYVLWLAALAAISGLGAWACWRARRALGLWEVPLPLAAAAVLWSTPVLFALERGQCDHLVLLLLVFAAWAMRGRSFGRDLAAGGCLGLAACLKLYPAFLILGVLALRRWRLAACFALICAGIGLTDVPGWLQAREKMGQVIADHYLPGQYVGLGLTNHSLTGCWKALWLGTPWARLAQVPALAASLSLVLPVVGAVSWRVWRTPEPAPLVFPYLVWLAAVATFVPPIANDYNLIFLPLAALAVWDRRDPVLVHGLMAFLLLWWQPLLLGIGPRMLFTFKLAGLAAMAVCLAGRARELAQGAGCQPAVVRRPAAAA
jgi:hypothetical protein